MVTKEMVTTEKKAEVSMFEAHLIQQARTPEGHKMTRITLALLAAMLIAMPAQAQKKDIVDTAVAAGNFKTLATALTKAGLIDTLKGKGPFTVFAPTDAAFAKVPADTITTLLMPKNKALLTSILTYHVVPGNLGATKVVGMKGLASVNGQRAVISKKHDGYYIDNAKITTTDIVCSNGVIHVIDSVIMPSSKSLVTTAVEAGSFKTLAAALKAANLVSALEAKGPFTVFAPTDDAFKKLPMGTVDTLLKPENKAKLTAVLTYHVVAGRVFSEAVVKTQSVKTLQGENITIAVKDGAVYVNNAKVIATDINAANGVIHVIDAVIMPPKSSSQTEAMAKRLITKAIDRGVPLYNADNHAACSAVYEFCGEVLMSLPTEHVDQATKNRLKMAMYKASQTHDMAERSWIMRRAFDQMLERML